MRYVFILFLLVGDIAFSQSWTIRTAEPDEFHPELVLFKGDSIPIKLSLSPAANFQFVPVYSLDTVAKTDRWMLSFVYRGHQLISFRGVNMRIDSTLHSLKPTEQPYQRMNSLLGADQVMEWFDIVIDEPFMSALATAKKIEFKFDAAREVKEVALKEKRMGYLQAFYRFALQKRKLLLGY